MSCCRALLAPYRVLALTALLTALARPAYAQSDFEVQIWPARKAPPATAGVDASDQPVPLSSLKGQALLINFWASWCEPCREEMPSLSQLAQSQSGKVRVLAVNFQEPASTVQRVQAATGWDLAVLRDPQGALARAWGIRVFPSTVLIAADGRVHSVVRGALDWSGAAAARLVTPLLPGAPVGAAPKPAPAAPP